MEWNEEAIARQRQMEREILCLKDTIWRLTSRVFVVESFMTSTNSEFESFVKNKYGTTSYQPSDVHSTDMSDSVKVIPIVIPNDPEPCNTLDMSKGEMIITGDHNIVDDSIDDEGTMEDEEDDPMSEEAGSSRASSSTVPDVIRIYKPDLKTFVTVKAEVSEPVDSQNPEADIECHICHKKFSHQENMQRHILIHRATQYKCDECGRGFSHQGNLKTHKLRHQRVKQRQAELEKRQQFIQNQPQTDLENRKHPCSYCDKRFYTAQQRNIHIRIHTGEKPYQCNLCGMKFNQKASLVDHNLGHAGEKNNICHICPAGFVRSRNLLKHIRQVHKMAQIKTVVNGERIVEFVPEDEAAAIIDSRKDNVETKKPLKPRMRKPKTENSPSSSVDSGDNAKKPRRTARANAGRNSKYEDKEDYADAAEEYAC